MTQYSFMPKQNVEDLARKLGLGHYAQRAEIIMPVKKTTGILEDKEFSITEDNEVYTISGIKYEGQIVTINLDKELLDNGESHTQDEWIKLTDKLPDITIYHATLSALFANKKGPHAELVKKVKKMFKKDFDGQDYMMTSTRMKYKPKSKDEIIHNYGSQQPRIAKIDFTGPDAWIDDKSGLEKQIEAILGTNDLKEIQKVYSWFGDKPYLWRLNAKPEQTIQGAVVLGRSVVNDGFVIGCDGIISGGPARGLVIVEQKKIV